MKRRIPQGSDQPRPHDRPKTFNVLGSGTWQELLISYLTHEALGAEMAKLRAWGVPFSKIWCVLQRQDSESISPAIFGTALCVYAEADDIMKTWVNSPQMSSNRFELLLRYDRHLKKPLPKTWEQAQAWLAEIDRILPLIKQEAIKDE